MNADKNRQQGEEHEGNWPEVPREDATKVTPLDPNKEDEQEQEQPHKEPRHTSAAAINAIISSPTDAVRSRRHTGTLGNTGTNTSYEGPTSNSPVGTGYNSGQSATGETINTSSGYDAAHIGRKKTETSGEENMDEESEKDII